MPTCALILLWPLLQTALDPIALSTRWDPAGTFDTGLDNLAAVVVCNAPHAPGGPLIAVDSTGHFAELTFGDGRWAVTRTFPTGVRVTAVCAGATRGVTQDWELFLGTASGQVVAMNRTMVGWSTQIVATLRGPILDLKTTQAVQEVPASLFVIDGDSLITEFVHGAGEWLSGSLPPIAGGATEICFHHDKSRLTVSAAGTGGVVYRIDVDSIGIWRPYPWAHLTAGPLDMASAGDPTLRDIALFYSGADGIFRYLFYERTDDEISRLPVGNGTDFLIGAGDMRRFNELFAMSGNEFCLFEFDTGLRDWIRIPISPVKQPVVSVDFGAARGQTDWQFYVASLDGTVHEFTRAKTPDPDDDE